MFSLFNVYDSLGDDCVVMLCCVLSMSECVCEQFVLSDTLSLPSQGNLLIYYLSNRCHIMPPKLTYKQTYISAKPVHICPYVLKSFVSESLSPRVDVSS